MEKRISYSVFQQVKSVAKACDPAITKRARIKAQIEKLQKEYDAEDQKIAMLEAGIKEYIGFRVEELVQKVMEPGVDANGKPKKTTKYLPTSIVTYDQATKQYVITTPDRVPQESEDVCLAMVAQADVVTDPVQVPGTSEGSDYDIDKENNKEDEWDDDPFSQQIL